MIVRLKLTCNGNFATLTAAILRERVNKITARIHTIENASAARDGLTVLKEVNWPPKPPAVEPARSAAVVAKESEPILPFYEIREFEDENGRSTGHEVLEMSKLMNEHGASGATTTSDADLTKDVQDEKTAKALEALEKKFAEATLRQQQNLDPEVAFAAELLNAPSVSAPADDLEFLNNLADEEDVSVHEQAAKALQLEAIKKEEAKRMPKASNGGWNTGFLGALDKRSRNSPVVNASNTSASAPKSVSAASPFGGAIIEKNI